MSSLLIVEPGFDGHRLEYVSIAVEVAAQLGRQSTVITSPQAFNSAEWLTTTWPQTPAVLCDIGVKNNLRQRTHDARLVIDRCHGSTSATFLNIGEYLLPLVWVSLRRRLPITGIMLRPGAGNGWKSAAKASVIRYLTLRGAAIYDLESPFTQRQDADSFVADPSGAAADREAAPADSRFEQTFSQWLERSDLPVVIVVGALAERKNIRFLTEFSAENDDVRIALVGKPDEVTREVARGAAAARPDQVFAWLERVAEADLDLAIRGSTVVALLYENAVGSSGILNRAARLNRPVISLQNAAVNNFIARTGLGASIDNLSAPSLRSAIRECEATSGTTVQTLDRAEILKTWHKLFSARDKSRGVASNG